MSAPPYMKLYVADYLADTLSLTRDQHGAYMLLLMAMWRASGKLPAADANLAAITKSTAKEWAALKPVILPFFTVKRGVVTHKRVAQELAGYETTSRKRSEAAKRGIEKKAKGNSDKAEAFAQQKKSKSTHNQNQNQNHKKSSEDKSSGDLALAMPIQLDPDKRAWADAVALLTERGRMTEARARSFFGGLLKTHGLAAKDMLASVGAGIANGTQDPTAYLTAAAKAKGRAPANAPQRDAGFV